LLADNGVCRERCMNPRSTPSGCTEFEGPNRQTPRLGVDHESRRYPTCVQYDRASEPGGAPRF
jgi:hypothetical protein